MSNAYGAGSPQAGLNAPGGMPSWLQNLWGYVNPVAQASAGGVDAEGRPQDAIIAAQKALAAQALNGGPQQSGPIASSRAANISVGGVPPLLRRRFPETRIAPIMLAGAGRGRRGYRTF